MMAANDNGGDGEDRRSGRERRDGERRSGEDRRGDERAGPGRRGSERRGEARRAEDRFDTDRFEMSRVTGGESAGGGWAFLLAPEAGTPADDPGREGTAVWTEDADAAAAFDGHGWIED